MAAFDFPNNPSNNQTYTDNGIKFIWNGSVWKKDATAGVKGEKGQKGEQGDKGQKGQKGIIGDVNKGQKGEIGPDGGDGGIGDKGNTGNKGEKGQKGTQGDIVAGTFNVTLNGAQNRYLIDSVEQPTLRLVRGFRYNFNVNVSGHPFWIKTSQTTGTSNGASGVTNNGAQTGTVVFDVPLSAPATLYYICQYHGYMYGIINTIENGQKGDKGQKGEDNSTKGQKGDDNSTKGQKGERGTDGTDGTDGTSVKGQKGQKGERGTDGTDGTSVKGQKGEDNSTKGQKGQQGDDNSTKGQKGEPAAGTNGVIKQVKSTTTTSSQNISVASGATVAISGFTVAITPSSSSSKILVSFSITGVMDNTRLAALTLTRNGSAVSGATGAFASAGSATMTGPQTISFQYLDSPSSTSSLTYGLTVKHEVFYTNTFYFNRDPGSGAEVFASTITAMEVG